MHAAEVPPYDVGPRRFDGGLPADEPVEARRQMAGHLIPVRGSEGAQRLGPHSMRERSDEDAPTFRRDPHRLGGELAGLLGLTAVEGYLGTDHQRAVVPQG